jgi:hypothetical protein
MSSETRSTQTDSAPFDLEENSLCLAAALTYYQIDV